MDPSLGNIRIDGDRLWQTLMASAEIGPGRAGGLRRLALDDADNAKDLGPEHPLVATSLENYAALLSETGRSAKANEIETDATSIRAKHAKENPAN